MFPADGVVAHDERIDRDRRRSTNVLYAVVMNVMSKDSVAIDKAYDAALDRRPARATVHIPDDHIIFSTPACAFDHRTSNLSISIQLARDGWMTVSPHMSAIKDDPAAPVSFGGLFGTEGPRVSRMIRVFRRHAIPVTYDDGTTGFILTLGACLLHRSDDSGDHNVQAELNDALEVVFRTTKPLAPGEEVVVSFAKLLSEVQKPTLRRTQLGPIDSAHQLYTLLRENFRMYGGADAAVPPGHFVTWMAYVVYVLKEQGTVPLQPTDLCAHCGAANPLYSCGKCMATTYCSRGCQKRDWKRHKNATACCCASSLLLKHIACTSAL
jgi:hypothetical protein